MTPEQRRERISSLTNLVENYTNKDMVGHQKCLEAMEELNLLRSHLEPRKSVAAIRRAAERQGFISYGDVGAESGLIWQEARRTMDRHLDDLCRWAHRRGWPLITSIVVEKPNVASGILGELALGGFIRAAHRLGLVVGTDSVAFLRSEQTRTFAWASEWREKDVFAVRGVQA